LNGERKSKDGRILGDEAIAARPRIQRIVLTYIHIEDIKIDEMAKPAAQSTLNQE
jgi:hypothetical protein